MIDPRIWQIAKDHLTEKQLEAWERSVKGQSSREIADALWLHRSTINDRIDAARLNLQRHGVRFTPDGRPYLEETNVA